MKPTWFELTQRRIKRSSLTESELRYLRLRLKRAFRPYRGEPYPHCTEDQARAIVDLIERKRPRVSDTQARKGVDWLCRLAFKKDGTLRNTDAARQFRDTDVATLKACWLKPRFALTGFDEHFNSYGDLVELAPIYRCFSDRGMWFDYTASAWQSGGAFAIVQHAYWPAVKVAA